MTENAYKNLKLGDEIFIVWTHSPVVGSATPNGPVVQLAPILAQWVGFEAGRKTSYLHVRVKNADGKSADLLIPEGEAALLIPGRVATLDKSLGLNLY